MGYAHIPNLYKDQTILIFKECWAMEKIHGTSAHVGWNADTKKLHFFSGGEKHDNFVALFDQDALTKLFEEKFPTFNVTIYGEAYGGKQQGMSATYGKQLKFVAFDVLVGDRWMDIPNADGICMSLGIEFVHYLRVGTDINILNEQRDKPSTQAVRNGIVEPMPSEGVVLRPIHEMTMNNGRRIVSKHKRAEFRETKTQREVDPTKFKAMEDAQAIATEWVTEMRLRHVLGKMPDGTGLENMRDVISAMLEDVYREGEGEVVRSPEADKAIGRETALVFKKYLQRALV